MDKTVSEKELEDYLDQVRVIVKNFAIRMANDHHRQMYADLNKLMSQDTETRRRVEELENELKKMKELNDIIWEREHGEES